MNLYMKQKIFSFKQSFNVFDEMGTPMYKIAGKFISIGRKIRIYDMAGTEQVYIKQRLFHLMPTYDIIIGNKTVARVIKKFQLLKNDYKFQGLNWEIKGSFLAHDYQILSNEDEVMSVAKKWLSWGDTYQLSINDNYDPLLCLACAVVIDCGCHENNS